MSSSAPYRVVLTFDLKPGMADEELRRSREDGSFPRRLMRQPGFVSMDLVKISDDRTMSIQTWESESAWWTALNAVKTAPSGDAVADREPILISREFVSGVVVETLVPGPA